MNKLGNGDAPVAFNRLQVWCTHWDCVTTQNVHVHTDTHTRTEASHTSVLRWCKGQRITQGYPVWKESLPWERMVRDTHSWGSLLGWRLSFHGAEMSLSCWLRTLSLDQGVLPLPIPTLGHERLVVSICHPGRRWMLLLQMYEKNFIGLREHVNRNWFS